MEWMMMANIGIRADGGPLIGMGHIMRCLSLAKEFQKSGYEVYFLSKIQDGIHRIQEEGFRVIQLRDTFVKETKGFFYGNESELVNEVEEITQAIKHYSIDILFIDSYNVTEKYFLQLKPHVKKLAYIDDINKFVYPVDILINGNITGEYMNYMKYSEDEILLLGPKYNLIRDEFRDLPQRVINKEVKEIMITTGGSDPYNMSTKIANMILCDNELKNVKINVIVGNGFQNKEELRKISKENPNVMLHENVKEISKIMLQSDIAISAGGSTLYELCACGTPTLAFVMADNQTDIVDVLSREQYIISMGWYSKFIDTVFIEKLIQLCRAYEKRIRLSRHMRGFVDGRGTIRIVNCMINLYEARSALQ